MGGGGGGKANAREGPTLENGVFFSCPLFYKENPGAEVMQYKHSPDESGDLGGRILPEKGQCWF